MMSVAGLCFVLTRAARPLLGILAFNYCIPAHSGTALCGWYICLRDRVLKGTL